VARSDAKERVLAEDGPSAKRLVIKLAQFEENRLLDLRYWYQDKKSGEFKPTQKGVSLTRKNYLTLKRIVDEHSEHVLDWLSISYVPEHVTIYEEQQKVKAEEIRHTLPAVTVSVESDRRSAAFFDARFEGGSAIVGLNEAHPFVERLLEVVETGNKQDAMTLIGQLLLGYASAAKTLSGATATNADVLFNQLEFEWSQTLKSAATGK
jgi:hypothetical protein